MFFSVHIFYPRWGEESCLNDDLFSPSIFKCSFCSASPLIIPNSRAFLSYLLASDLLVFQLQGQASVRVSVPSPLLYSSLAATQLTKDTWLAFVPSFLRWSYPTAQVDQKLEILLILPPERRDDGREPPHPVPKGMLLPLPFVALRFSLSHYAAQAGRKIIILPLATECYNYRPC